MNFISQKFIEYYKTHPVLTSVNILLPMTFPVDDFLIPYMTGKLINSLQNKKPWLSKLIILVIILISMQIIYSLNSWHDALIIPSIQNFIKHEMISDILHKFQYNNKEPLIGEIMSRLVKIPITMTFLYEQFKNYIFTTFLSFLFTASYIMTIDIKLGLGILIAIIIVFCIILLSPLNCIKVTEQQESSLSKIDDENEDILRNITTIYINNQIDNELTRLTKYEKNYSNLFFQTMTCTIKTRFIAIFILTLMMIFVIYRAYTGIKNNTLDIGSFVAILLILTNWFTTLGWLIAYIRDLVINWGIIDAYDKMLISQKSSSQESKIQEININPPKEGILFYNVSYVVESKNKPILDKLTLYIPKHTRVVIIGQIGSGKSTTLKLLLGLIKPSSGEIYIDGVPISQIDILELRKKITYVAQNPILFNRSIYENITYGLQNKPDIKYISELMALLDLNDSFSNLELGLNTSCGKNGSGLSGGQRQIVSILRAYLLNPDIIALDEITSSIDENTRNKIFKVLDQLFIDKTILIVTHDPSLSKFATMKCEMVDGKLAC
jgi:ATP-binding cassette subfamily B protein